VTFNKTSPVGITGHTIYMILDLFVYNFIPLHIFQPASAIPREHISMQLKDTAEGFSSILLLHNDDFPEDS
jgi:hypothetical protein